MKKLLVILNILVTGTSAVVGQSLKEGQRLIEIENYDKAKEVLKQLFKKDPSAENAYYLGNAYYQLNKMDSASFYYNEGIKKDAQYPLNYVGEGKVIYQKDPGQAKKHFEKALQIKSGNPQTVQAVADAYIQKDPLEVPAAISLLDEAIKKYPKNVELVLLKGDAYWKIKDGNKAIAAYNEALKLDPKHPKTLLSLGDSYQRVMNYDKSVEYFNQALSADTGYVPAYRELGDSYFRLKNKEKTNESYRKYVQLGGQDPNTRVYYGSNLISSGDYKKALQVLMPLEKKEPVDPVLYRLLGIAYYENESYDKSVENLHKLMQKGEVKKIAVDYDYLGRSYLKKEQDSLAVQNLEKAVQMDSSRYTALSDLGSAYLRMKKFDKASKVYQYKVDKKQASALDAFNLGRAYFYTQDFPKADTSFGYVIQAAADYAPAYYWKARVKAAMDPKSEKGLAKPYFEKFINVAKGDVKENKKELVEAYDYLGYYYLTKKDKVKAKEAYTKIKELDPGNKKAEDGLKAVNAMK